MKKSSLCVLVLCIILTGCDYFSDAKKLAEELSYYKSQCASLTNQLQQARNEIDKLRSELEKSKNLHKKMLE